MLCLLTRHSLLLEQKQRHLRGSYKWGMSFKLDFPHSSDQALYLITLSIIMKKYKTFFHTVSPHLELLYLLDNHHK